MNILIACDSFKDALSAIDVCRAIQEGILAASPQTTCKLFPLADGGEGLTDVLSYHLGFRQIEVAVSDPLLRKINAQYGLSLDGAIAFIEMAQAAGLQLLAPAERNPMFTTTYGVGELIRHAITQGARRIIVGLGGSATNDTGVGMASALGFQFLDKNGQPVKPVGSQLYRIEQIIGTSLDLQGLSFDAMCDVTNPLYGADGAARVYGPQKGASDADVERLDEGLKHMAALSSANDTLAIQPGAGAAGGMGFGLTRFLGARLQRGIDLLMEMTGFEAQLAWADMVITGEGRLDSQTAQGKLISGIASRAQKHHKPVIALCGALEAEPALISNLGLTAAFSITPKPCSLEQALANTKHNLTITAFNVARVLEVNCEQ